MTPQQQTPLLLRELDDARDPTPPLVRLVPPTADAAAPARLDEAGLRGPVRGGPTGARQRAPHMGISVLRNEDARWDAFVNDHPDGTLHHTLAWRRMIERAFGHR